MVILKCIVKVFSELKNVSLSAVEGLCQYIYIRLEQKKSIKLKASTLVESLVASVIIIIVFTIASLTLNNVFNSTVKNNTDRLQNRMNTLEYFYLNDKIVLPYQEDFEDWNIQFLKPQSGNSFLTVNAVHIKTKKSISRKLTYVVSQ